MVIFWTIINLSGISKTQAVIHIMKSHGAPILNMGA